MQNPLQTIDRILFLDLRPWLIGKESDLKFKQLLIDLPKQYFTFKPIYEVDFIKPLSNFRKYYKHLIDNDTTKYLNDLHAEIATATNPAEIKYLVHFALTRTLSQKLKEIQQTITDRNYLPEQFDLTLSKTFADKNMADESYILHYLKHQVVRLYLEVQDAWKDHLKDEQLTEEELYFKYFEEPSPQPSFIIPAINYPKLRPAINVEKETDGKSFNPLRQDIREAKKGVYSYDQLVKNQNRFAQIEEDLYANGLINEDYNFIDEYGQKLLLAAFYHQIIRKGYFNKRVFPEKIDAKPIHIRKFLDHRYNTDVDKQFRNWELKRDELMNYIDKYYWLTRMLSC